MSMSAVAEPAKLEGTTTSGYRRLCVLAEGGMGEVELVAREEGRFQRLYAVKRLRDSFRNEPEFHRMFLEEARIAGLLRHTHVVSVLDVGEDARGPYLLMDYIEGVSVSDLIRASATTRHEVPLQVALQIVAQAARGLHAAHELSDPQGEKLHLVHRDVSPQNLLVGFDGTTRVTDFGIAKAYGSTTQTATGILKGKLGYLSPEQLRFEEPDRRSDLFSLGVVLFELLTGRRLYKSVDGNDGPRRILNEPPPDIGEYREDASPGLVELMFSMLAKDPKQRPATAANVADQLESLWLDEVQAEGRIDLGEYLREAFADRRAERQSLISQARDEGSIERLPHAISVEVVLPDEPPPPRRWPVYLGGALLLGLGLSAGLAIAWGARPEADQVAAAKAAMPPLVAASPPADAEPALGQGDEPRVDQPSPAAPPTSEPPAVEEEQPSTPPAATESVGAGARPRRGGAGRGRSRTSTGAAAGGGSAGVPRWDWD